MLKVAPVEQRKELLIETQLLNDEVNNLSNEVKEQYSQMDKVNKLLQEHTTAQDSLRKAESILSTLKNQIEFFIQKHSLTLV